MNNNIPAWQPISGVAELEKQKRQLKVGSIWLLVFSLVLLGAALALGALVNGQIRVLEANVQLTQQIIDANVRSLGQAQRELLRMALLLESGSDDVEALEMQRAFVAQRMHEATLSFQLQALGSEELLAQSRGLSARWAQEVEPLIDQVMAQADDDDTAVRIAAVTQIRELEQGFNQLVAQGEIMRKQQAGQASASTSAILASERVLLSGVAIVIVGFILFLAALAVIYYRFDTQRDRLSQHLARLNAEMRVLSQVASRTDHMVIIADAAGDIKWVNSAFSRIAAYTLSDVSGRSLVATLVGPESDAQSVAQLQDAVRRGAVLSIETFSYTGAGHAYWANIEIQPVRDETGELTNIIAVVVDLSRQRRRELAAAQNSRLLDVINRAQNEFILTNQPGVMFERLLESLLSMSESEYGFIGEVLYTEAGAPYLKTHAITNIAWSEETRTMYERQAAGGMEFHNLDTLFGAALRTQQPVIANDPATDPRSGGMPAGHPPMNAFLGVPFFNARQEMVGLIGIANRPEGYDQELVTFLQPFLATCGNLIEAYRSELSRQEAEAALVQLNERLEKSSEEATEQRDFALQIMNNMGQGLTVVDEDGRFTYVNPAYARMVNEEPGALIGRSPEEFTLAEDREVLASAGERRREGDIGTYETRIKRSDGEVIDALITGVPRYRHKKYAGSIAVITNLTERKRAEAALRRSEAEARKLSQVASRTDNLVIITDPLGNIEWVNTAFTRVTGYTLDEVIGRRPGHLLQGTDTDSEVVAYMRERVRAGQAFKAEVLNYAKDGRAYWVQIEVQPVHDQDGLLTNFIAIETDVTRRKLDREQLRAAKEAAEAAAQAKSAFLASMSHEIRTPLNAVIGLNGLLLETDLNETQRNFAETARNSGNLLLMLVNNVLDFSALESGRVELEERPFTLQHTLEETVALLGHEARRKRLSLTYVIDGSVPPILVGDETRLRQVLLNLLGNSLKFTENGSITITVEARQETTRTMLEFTVRDTGIGIPAERVERLFQPFVQGDASTTRKYGGTGLGLAITRLIVKMMGGVVGVQSTVGRGTTVSFTLQMGIGDAASLPVTRPGTEEIDPMGQRWPLRVLVVEDDAVNWQVARQMLQSLGYNADYAADGAAALEAIERHGYDVIFMDIHMPVMDGITATRRIRERWPVGEAPYIIAMTASALEGDRERFMAAGLDDYVSKPVQPSVLAAALRQALPAESAGQMPVQAKPDKGRSNEVNDGTPINTGAFSERMGTGQQALLQRLVELFISEARQTLPRLSQAVAAAETDDVRKLAHLLKGSGASVAADSFAATASALEQQARRGDLAGADDQVAALAAELERVESWAAMEHA